MSALRLNRPMALALLLLATTATLFVVDAAWMSLMSPPPTESNYDYAPAIALGALVGLVYAMCWGAATLGLYALWNVLRDEPLRRPIVAFGIGLAAFIAAQALGSMAYQDYKTRQPVAERPNSVPSEAQPLEETK